MDATAQLDSPPAAPLRGMQVAFTGRLEAMGRDAAERLVRSLGGVPASGLTARTHLLVVGMRGWALREDGRVSRSFEQARRSRTRIVSETEFLRLAGLAPPHAMGTRPYTLAQAAEASGVGVEEIRRWELAGLVSAREGLYDFQDLVSLRAIAALRRRGVPLRTIRDSLRQLADVLPGIGRPLAQVQVLDADGGELLAQIGESLFLSSGQQVIDFDGRTRSVGEAIGPIPAAAAPEGASWEDWLERGLELEEEGRHADAANAYGRAAVLKPEAAVAHFNLANALAALGRHKAAEEALRLAVAIDPGLETAWYNLAGILEAAGRRDEAAEALRRAVAASPAFADARFNLAACLHDLGRTREASEHWRAYLALDPSSKWAGVARRLASSATGPDRRRPSIVRLSRSRPS
jgi:tetratricopeptide (TPR) repeat protein